MRPLALMLKAQYVAPNRFVVRCLCKSNLYTHLGILACVQATQFLDATAVMHCLLQTATLRLADVSKKSEDI
ncbi:hypothetical protein ADU20_16630 [Burkholderia pseudomallei]|nr:hypothetical protein ADU20_16630 [Burkholderia pseudomallei]OAB12820.1 hypothetical protein AQ853_29190 [Burkholderia pseudomallei]ONC23141.1 hypothetical protein AQ913_11595 [Burkholderia pseudomallei]RAQ91886.1 hypothetical protein A4G85_31330 [Burkholderia pseudomallei]